MSILEQLNVLIYKLQRVKLDADRWWSTGLQMCCSEFGWRWKWIFGSCQRGADLCLCYLNNAMQRRGMRERTLQEYVLKWCLYRWALKRTLDGILFVRFCFFGGFTAVYNWRLLLDALQMGMCCILSMAVCMGYMYLQVGLQKDIRWRRIPVAGFCTKSKGGRG